MWHFYSTYITKLERKERKLPGHINKKEFRARAFKRCQHRGNLGDAVDTGLQSRSCNFNDRRYDLEHTRWETGAEVLAESQYSAGLPFQVQGARKTLPNAPGKLQSGCVYPDCWWELGSLLTEIKTSSLHMGVETKITITMWCKIPKMRNWHKNRPQMSKTLETPIISKTLLCWNFHNPRCIGRSWRG